MSKKIKNEFDEKDSNILVMGKCGFIDDIIMGHGRRSGHCKKQIVE